VSWYQKGKTNLDFNEARGSEWQWHQLGRMQVCTSLQTDNHASTPPLYNKGFVIKLLLDVNLVSTKTHYEKLLKYFQLSWDLVKFN